MNSSRHHYIPKFLLDGFKNSDGLLYVFDKQKNKIIKTPQSPKAIFFEHERNTINLTGTEKSSVIEDVIFSKIDSDSSKVVKSFQVDQLDKIDFTPENNARFLFFLITLFWRIPYTDNAADDIMNRSNLYPNNINTDALKNDPTYKKFQRTSLFKHQVEEMERLGSKTNKYVNIYQSQDDIYLIGDNPILFKKTPSFFYEFNDIDFLIAISSKRIYSSTNNKINKITIHNSKLYNLSVIHQSVRYVGSKNYNILQKSIQDYNECKNHGLQYLLAEKTFEI